MRANLLTPAARFYEDQTLVLVAFGGFGRYVLHLLRQEFGRLQLPKDRVFFLAFDTDRAHRDEVDRDAESDGFVHLEPFQPEVYLANRENETLRQAMSHLPESALREVSDGCKGLPGVGFVTFHRYDETLITTSLRALIDEARAKNPGGKIKCIVVAGMGGGTSNGMTVPFLFRVREHLKHKKVRLEVFLATSEGHTGLQNISEERIERNCVANAMLWEQVLLGERDFVYPGKEGVREERSFRGPLQHRTWIFSGGAGNTTYSYRVIASIVSSCIATLELTRLGSYLDGDRVNYAEDILDRTWKGQSERHPTALLAMNVGGLKIDCFPTLFHLRAVRAFLDEVSRSPQPEAEASLRAEAEACVQQSRLSDECVVSDLGIGQRPLGREEIAAARLPQEKLHGYISARLEEDVGELVRLAEGAVPVQSTDPLLDRARAAISSRAAAIASSPNGWLPGAIFFYETLQRHFLAQRRAVLERGALARAELGNTPSRERLNLLLERLKRDTVPGEGSRFGVVERFVATLTVSVPTQVRKILEVAAEIRGHALVLATSTVLASVYESLAAFCDKQRELLQGRLYAVNTATSACMREEEMAVRASRSAFTYQRARFEPLVDHLWEVLRVRVPLPPTSEVVARIGGDLPAFLGSEPQVLERLLAAVQVDSAAIAAAADEVLCTDGQVRDVLKESLAQFFPTIQVDRDRFPTLETARSRFVLCSRRMYEAYRDDIFEGYHHLETENPWNVLVTQHEEGLPFIALTYLRRIHEAYAAQVESGRAALGHPTADLAASLPLLDA
jgi:hypothetical protein